MNISTVSGITQGFIPQAYMNFITPLLQYVITPAVVFSIVLFVIYKIFNVGKLIEKFTQVVTSVADLEQDVKILLSNMNVVKTHLVTNAGLNAHLFSPGSPLKLMPKGLELLEKSGFKKIYQDNKAWFIDEIRKTKASTLADIDEQSYRILDYCNNHDRFIKFKEVAFQNGVSLEVLLRVFSIYLRDQLANEVLDKAQE